MSKLIEAHILQALQQRIKHQQGGKSHSSMVITTGTEQRTETTRDKYADLCDKQAVSTAASCSSRVVATLEEEKQDKQVARQRNTEKSASKESKNKLLIRLPQRTHILFSSNKKLM